MSCLNVYQVRAIIHSKYPHRLSDDYQLVNIIRVVDCGKPAPTSLIGPGGEVAKLGAAPWHVAIFSKKVANPSLQLICGGTLIAPNAVLSGKSIYIVFNCGQCELIIILAICSNSCSLFLQLHR